MKIFLAGATGAIGKRLVPQLIEAGHAVTGMTRSAERAAELKRAGATPVVADVFDADKVRQAVEDARPDVIIHQLTDLPRVLDQDRIAAAYAGNARIRTEGTRNLIAAAQAASARRLIVQSIAFAYVPGGEPHPETDPLNVAEGPRVMTARGAADMEAQVLGAQGIAGIVLRYGFLYGAGTWYASAPPRPALHVDAAAQAALLALTRGDRGVYNIAEDDGVVSIEKARRQLGFDPAFRAFSGKSLPRT